MRKRFAIMVAFTLFGCAGSQTGRQGPPNCSACSALGSVAPENSNTKNSWPTHAGMEGAVAIKSLGSVAESVARLQAAIKANGLTLFATIDHTRNAANANLKLRPTVLIVFGNPKVGTQLMNASPTLGISLPMKILIYQADDNTVWVVHEAPAHLAYRHQLDGKEELLKKIADALRGLSKVAAGQ